MLATAFTSVATAQEWILDPAFAPVIVDASGAGSVSRLECDAAGRVTAVGSFSQVDGRPRASLARFLPTGGLDAAFAPESATLLLLPPDGGGPVVLLLGRVQRLRDDGRPDPAFAFPTDIDATKTRWLAAAPDGRLLIAAFDPDDSREENLKLIWLGGNGRRVATLPTVFRGYGRYEPGHFRMIGHPDPIDGMPVFTVTNEWIEPQIIPSNLMTTAQLLTDERLLVTGIFQLVNDAPRKNAVWLRGDGSVDGSPAPAVSPAIYVSNLGQDTNEVLPLPDGHAIRIVAVSPRQPPQVTRILPDETTDDSFCPPTVSLQPGTRVLADGSFFSAGRRFLPDAWPDLNFHPDARRGSATATLSAALRHPDGSLWIAGNFDYVDGKRRNALARLLPVNRPVISVPPADQTVVAGRAALFRIAVGTLAPTTIQWTHNGVAVPGATNDRLEIARARPADAGIYRTIVTLDGSTLLSDPATLTVIPNTSRLINFSYLGNVSPASPHLICWVTEGAGAHEVLLRATGKGLNPAFPGMLPDPVLTLYANGQFLAEDHGGALAPRVTDMAQAVGAFRLSTYGFFFHELNYGSALVPRIGAGTFTAVARSGDGGSGTALFEFYDIPNLSDAGPRLRNISMRGRTEPGWPSLVAGLVVQGNGPLRFLVRGIGPTLGSFGIANTLVDPWLSLSGPAFAENRGWGGAAQLADAARKVGAFPLPSESRDAALLLSLEPGSYQLQLGTSNAAAGIGMLEIYVVDD